MENQYRNELKEIANMGMNYQCYDRLFAELMKPSPKIYLLDLCELKDRHIEVVYHDEKTPEEMQEDCIDKQEILLWMIKNSKHVITHEGHNYNGVLDQWTHTYNPEDLLADPLSRYQLVEEFINETENGRICEVSLWDHPTILKEKESCNPLNCLYNKKRWYDENEQIYLQTKSNYKDNGIYEDNETDD